jgi:oligoribonuclease NrnB/cAMP/cGMP phosphodiesterase (DHH superfamily)
VIGSFANHLAGVDPRRAHAVMVPNGRGALMVSLRMPAGSENSAHQLCHRFGGGGRRVAAGIDHLEESELAGFLAALEAACAAS